MESSTHSLNDAAMKCLPVMLPVLDFSTVKNEIFPPIAATFSKTNSLAIKIRGLEAFVVLCGGSLDKDAEQNDDLSGVIEDKKASRATPSSILDKYTVQEKLVPLLKAIKTKEPAVMMAALNVFRQVGGLVDTEFIAMEVLPTLWSFSLGPLLNLQQFEKFMLLIKSLSTKVEREQVRKLRELSTRNDSSTPRQSIGAPLGGIEVVGVNETTSDFEQLVLGRSGASNTNGNGGWDNWSSDTVATAKPASQVASPRFSWSSSNPSQQPTNKAMSAVAMSSAFSSTGHTSRSVTPDSSISAFPPLEASRPAPSMGAAMGTAFPSLQPSAPSTPSWNQLPQQQAANRPSLSQWGSASSSGSTFAQTAQPTPNYSSFSIPPPPVSSVSQPQQWQQQQQQPAQPNIWATPAPAQPAGQQKQGLDKYASLL